MNLTSASFFQLGTRLRGSPFFANILQMLSGGLAVQAIGFASMPLLTRLYGPEAFGVLGIFIAVTEVGGKMATLRYDVALVLPREDRDAWALLRFSGMACLLFALIALIGSYPFREPISRALGVASLAHYFPLMALMIVGLGWQMLAVFWATRGKFFKAISKSSAVAALIGNGFKILAGMFGFGPIGLLIGALLQRWIHLPLLAFALPSSARWGQAAKGESLRQAKIYHEFPKYRMPHDTLNTFTRQLPKVLLASFFGPAAAGFYILTTRVLELPFAMIQEAIRKVFYVKAVETDREGRSLYRLCVRLALLILAGMLPVAFVTIIWGDFLFEWVFGSEWTTSGLYAKWVIFAVLFNFCTVPFSIVIPIIGWNRFYLVFEVLSTLLRISVIILAGMLSTPYVTVVSIALASVLGCLIFMGILTQALRARESALRQSSVQP